MRTIQLPILSPPEQDRFWSHVDKNRASGCWVWTASTVTAGYGRLRIMTVTGEKVLARAHRIAYRLLVGIIPDGMHLDHLCRNHACVNPTHLEVVTAQVNILRGVGLSAANAKKTHCMRGHPFDEVNTLWYGRHRQCHTCNKAKDKARYLRPKVQT